MKAEPSSSETIYQTLRRRIFTEEYAAGQKLSEHALVGEFNCSRTPIREAFKRLEADLLVLVKPRSGTYVRRHFSKDNRDLIEVRAYLEGLAFRLATQTEDTKGPDVSRLTELVSQMDAVIDRKPLDMLAFADLHYQFHLAIIDLSANELLRQMYDRLNLKSSHLFLLSMNEDTAGVTQNEHRQIIQMLANRDPKGEKFMIGHLWKKREIMY